MKYIVREPGKTGGTEFSHSIAAVEAALEWYEATGIACEIWASFPDRNITYRVRDSELEARFSKPTFKTMSHAFLGD